MIGFENIKKISDFEWEIPRAYRADMLVPVRIFAAESIVRQSLGDRSLEQAVNVAFLPE